MTAHELPALLNRWLAPLGTEMPNFFVVGGALRDHLLGRLPRDVDIVCPAAEDTARRIATACASGATVVRLEKKPHAPCFRVVDRNNPADFIDVVPLRGGGINADLAARDFTVNAMAAVVLPGGRLGDIIDPFDGRGDMANGLIRACSPAVFSSDPVRVLRAARFSATLGFTVTPDTLFLMRESAGLPARCAFERVTVELLELLASPDALPHIRLLDDIGTLEALFPEISAMKGCGQNAFHHLDVWGHCLETLNHCERFLRRPDALFSKTAQAFCESLSGKNRVSLIKLAALFHDAGKPGCKNFDAQKTRHVFHGHDRQGEDLAGVVARRMKLSGADTTFFMRLVGGHMRPMELSRPRVRTATITRWFETVGDDGLALLLLAGADVCAKSGRQSDPDKKERFLTWIEHTADDYCNRIKRVLRQPDLLSGADLQELGMSPGPAMGRVLRTVRKHQNDGRITDRAAALSLARQLAGAS